MFTTGDLSGSFTTEDHLVSCFKFKVGVFYIVFPAFITSSTFKDLCSKYKVTWQDGCGYYAVVRSAKIHDGKELLLQNYKTNKFIVGREAVLRATKWPDSELKKGAKDVPADHTLFAQSESCNRVIPPGTQVLFEVTAEEHAKHKVINAAALEAAQDMAKTGAVVASAGKDSKAKAAARADPKVRHPSTPTKNAQTMKMSLQRQALKRCQRSRSANALDPVPRQVLRRQVVIRRLGTISWMQSFPNDRLQLCVQK